jgi:hypothetical protein
MHWRDQGSVLASSDLSTTVASCVIKADYTLASQEAEIRRIVVRSQPRQTVEETLSQKKTFTHTKSIDPEFKPRYCKTTTKTTKTDYFPKPLWVQISKCHQHRALNIQ